MNTVATKLVILAALTLSVGTGCAASATSARPAQAGPAKWETVTLADGVEIRVNEEAGPDARRVVEQIQSEMRSRYMSAR